jgi:hypothetical protein
MFFLNMIFQISAMFVFCIANFTEIKVVFLHMLSIYLILILMAILYMSYERRFISKLTLTNFTDEHLFLMLLLDFIIPNFNLLVRLLFSLSFKFFGFSKGFVGMVPKVPLAYGQDNRIFNSQWIIAGLVGYLWLMLILYKLHKVLVSKHRGKFIINRAGIILI